VVSQPLSETAKTLRRRRSTAGLCVKSTNSKPYDKIYNIPDPVIQDSSESVPELAITPRFQFDGMNGQQAGGVIPPDTNGAVGDNQFFLITNFAFSIYNKSPARSGRTAAR